MISPLPYQTPGPNSLHPEPRTPCSNMPAHSTSVSQGPLQRSAVAIARWFDASKGTHDRTDDERIDWLRVLPFVAMHAACLGVIRVGFSWIAFWVALTLY